MIEYLDKIGIDLFFGSDSVFLDQMALVLTNAYAWVPMFIALFILSLPFWNFDFINNSKLRPAILESSPILSKITKNTYNAGVDIYEEIKDTSDNNDRSKLNLTIIKLLLKYNVIDKEYLKELRLHSKLNIPGIDSLIGG